MKLVAYQANHLLNFAKFMHIKMICLLFTAFGLFSCGKEKEDQSGLPSPSSFSFASLLVDGSFKGFVYQDIRRTPQIKISFSAPLDRNTVGAAVSIKDKGGSAASFTTAFENNDSTLVFQPSLNYLTKYDVSVSTALKTKSNGQLQSPVILSLLTHIDSSDKFPQITDDALLTQVQKQTFSYFWDFGHPVSGLARERNTSGDVVAIGGSGFGIMAMVAAIQRNFISRAQGLERMQRIVNFLKTKAQTFHGVFPHWLNGSTGEVVPFSTKDNGADLVETSYLIMGLLTARQYFNGSDAAESTLRSDINALWHAVEWSWFRQNGQNVLYWHWSPNYGWEMNHPIKGWNECLITYVLAASSPTYPVSKAVYDNGWASNGSMKNGNTYLGHTLPLGPPFGGPLFFAHYSFLGINPKDLTDAYANYWTQNRNHTFINYSYCVSNPKGFYGYSGSNWGLTASDDIQGYKAHSPTNDNGVISPTAALSSFPYTPEESMRALKFLYYKLGDKLWGTYGFYDAFSLNEPWFATSTLAIDQGPIIVMIENYRSGLLWNLFTSCSEVKSGMRNLGFTAPYL
jgi:hypothetical protein